MYLLYLNFTLLFLVLQRPYFTIMTEYASNGRYKLSNWIMGCLFFRYNAGSINNPKEQFHPVQLSYVFPYNKRCGFKSCNLHLAEEFNLAIISFVISHWKQTNGGSLLVFISSEYLGRCYWHEKGWQIRKLFIKRGTRYVSEGPFCPSRD